MSEQTDYISWDEARDKHRKEVAEAKANGNESFIKVWGLGEPFEDIDPDDVKEAEYLMDVREIPDPAGGFDSHNGYEEVGPVYRKFAGKHTGINAEKVAEFLIWLSSYNEFGGEQELFDLVVELDKQNASWGLTEKLAKHFTEEMRKAPKDRELW